MKRSGVLLTLLAFALLRRGRNTLLTLVAAVAVSAALLLVLAATKPAEAAFPGENGRIAFASTRDGNYEIYTMNPDGSDQRRITNNPASDTEPTWSANGRRIAFTSIRSGGVSQVFVMGANGGGVRQVTKAKAPSYSPSWSPDGKRLVFSREVGGRRDVDIFVVNADGTGGRNILDGVGSQYDPAWSPDGKRIVYADNNYAVTSRDQYSLCTVSPKGTQRDCFEKDYDYAFLDPNFSPNGSSVVFETYFSSSDESRIEISRIDGVGRRQNIRVTLSGYVAVRPVFSPDGAKVAYADYDYEDDGKGQQIYIVNRDGSGNMQITDVEQGQGYVNRQPDWQPLP